MDLNATRNLIDSLNGYTICSIAYLSQPKLLVKSRKNSAIKIDDVVPTREIYKLSQSNYGLGFGYEVANNRRLSQAGSDTVFVSSTPSFHHVSRSFVISSKGNDQLLVQVIKSSKPKSVYFYFNEDKQIVEVDHNLLKDFLPLPSKKVELDEGVEKIEVRTLNLDSIIRMKICGQTYSKFDISNLNLD